MKTRTWCLLLCVVAWWPALPAGAQELSATEIVRRADEKMRGTESSTGEVKMTIVRPTWTREMQLKTWVKGTDYALILVTAPARERGTAFLKRGNEIWNWQPSIDRVVKLPPSMMSQSWMGSDFTNDDLVKESSMVEDFEHRLLGREEVGGRLCYQIELTPRPDAAVVWGKILTWIDRQDFVQMKAEFYDEDGWLVNTMVTTRAGEMGGKVIPIVMEVIPADKPGHKTVMEQLSIEFDKPIPDDFFSIQNMKRLRL
ncbi:outer membrane lipoprotein-sorting protein [Rhodocaloribacter litoris]|uniref:outer membrane lipoprotein-sorting protein n=1 Tax=Rhodocaloribacter litoris TaxID=2558931 RepID=UPI0014227A6D|nr:outer membrane lipoprotein-sorting protein [Rhodocaloribacter litoris]QXD13780.1 outer membrane lipoprotein-sorting protein [Rhodocaloribacter litoris]